MLVFNVLFQTKSSPENNYLILLIVSNTEFLESQFATSSTFKGTGRHHQFIPIASSLNLAMRKTSFAKVSGSSKVQMTTEDIKPGRFCWYFCVADYLSGEYDDEILAP